MRMGSGSVALGLYLQQRALPVNRRLHFLPWPVDTWHHARVAGNADGGAPEPSRDGPVVLCGLGRVGQGILDLLLRLGERVAVVTLPAEAEAGVPSKGVRIIVGDARDENVLALAGLDQAKALIAATDRDLDNVMIALHARQVAPHLPVVVRLFDENLADHLRDSLGIRHGYSASALAAPAFVAAALGDAVVTTFEAGGVTWDVEQYSVSRGSSWVGRSLGEFSASGPVVLALERGQVFSPSPAGSETLAEGDRLTMLARAGRCRPVRSHRRGRLRTFGLALCEWWKSTPRGLRFSMYALLGLLAVTVGVFHWSMRLSLIDAYYFAITTFTTTGYGDFNLQASPPLLKLYGTLVMISGAALFAVLFSMATDLLLRTRLGDLMAQGLAHQRGHIVVAGLGHTGFRVVRELSRMGETVVAIENNPSAEFLSTARVWAPVIAGSAGAAETLRRAGLAGAKTVIAVTDSDLTNLSAAMASKRARRDCRVVARVFEQKLAERVRGSLGIDAVLSVTNATAPTFVGAALDAGTLRGLVLSDHLLLIAERASANALRVGEQMLLVRPGGTSCRLADPNATVASGDQVLAVRWIKLRS
jgi:Trk K+ transport system NAD-binding subunit